MTAESPPVVSGRILRRRRDDEVMIVLDEVVFASEGRNVLGRLPLGYRPLYRVRESWYPGSDSPAAGSLTIAPDGYFNIYDVIAGAVYASLRFSTSQSWPT